MTSKTQNLFSAILRGLNGDFLYSRLDSLLPGAQRYPVYVKSHCPYHEDGRFRSFLVDLNRRVAWCTNRRCEARHEIDLVSLIAKLTGKHPIQVLLQLVAESAMQLESSYREDLEELVIEEVQALASIGDEETARMLIDMCTNLSADSLSLELQSNLLFMHQDLESSVDNLFALAERCLERDDILLIYQIMEQLELLASDDERLLVLKARIAETRGERRAAADFYQAYIERLEQSDSTDLQNGRQARMLEKILMLNPSSIEARRRYAQWLDGQGMDEEARNHWNVLLKVLHAEHKMEEALELSRSIVQKRPGDLQAKLHHARFCQETGRMDEAVETFENVMQDYIAAEEWDEAEHYCRQLMDIQPERQDLPFQLIQILNNGGRPERAYHQTEKILPRMEQKGDREGQLNLLRQMMQWKPQNTASREKLARLLSREGNSEELHTVLCDLARLYFGRKLSEEGASRLRKATSLAQGDLIRLQEIAEIYQEQGLSSGACQIMEQMGRAVVSDNPEHALALSKQGLELEPDSMSLMALQIEAYRALNQEDKILDVLERMGGPEATKAGKRGALSLERLRGLVDAYPQTLAFRLLLAGALADQGRFDDALDEIRLLVKRASSESEYNQTAQLLAKIQGQQGPRIETLDLQTQIYELLGDEDRLFTALNSLAGLCARMKQGQRASAIYERLSAMRPDDATLLQEYAEFARTEMKPAEAAPLWQRLHELLRGQGETERAADALRQAIRGLPEPYALRKQLADFLAESSGWEAAAEEYRRLLNDMRGVKPEDPLVRQCLDKLYEHNEEDPVLLREMAEEAEAQRDVIRSVDLYQKAAELHYLIDNLDDARECYERALKLRPHDLALMAPLADVHEQQGAKDLAIEIHERMLSIYTDQLQAEKVLEAQAKILRLTPQREDLAQQRISLLRKLNRNDQAQECYANLIEHYRKQAQWDEAIRLTRQLLDDYPERRDAREQLIELLTQTGDTAEAIEEYAQMAEFLLARKEREAALETMSQWRKLAPDDTSLLERIASLHVKLGRVDEGMQHYRTLLDDCLKINNLEGAVKYGRTLIELNPDNWELRHDLAKWLHGAGKLQDASDVMLEVVQRRFRDGQIKEAQEAVKPLLSWLDSLDSRRLKLAMLLDSSELSSEAEPIYVSWAQAALNAKQYAQTVECCDQGIASDAGRKALYELKAEALSQLGDPEKAAREWSRLARLHHEDKSAQSAVKAFERAIQLEPQALDLREDYCRYLMNTGVLGQTQAPLRELINLCAKAKDTERELTWREQLSKVDALDYDNRFVLSELLIKAGDGGSAERQLRLLLDDAMASEKKDEGFRTAERALNMLRQLLPNDEGLLRNEISLAQSRKDDERVGALRLELADLLERHNRSDEAAEIYRELLRETPEDDALFEKVAAILKRQGPNTRLYVHWLEDRCEFERKRNGHPRIRELRLRIVDAEPDNLENRWNLASACMKLKQPEEAIEHLRHALKIESMQGNTRAAEKLASEILKIDPELVDVREQYAQFLTDLKQQTQALEEMRRLVDHFQQSGGVANELRWRGSLMAMSPADMKNRFRMADLLKQESRLDEAADVLRSIIRESMGRLTETGTQEAARNASAMLREWMPDDEDARRDEIELYTALGEGERARELMVELGAWLERNERYSEAVDLYRKLLRRQPGQDELFERVAALLQKQGMTAEYKEWINDRAEYQSQQANWKAVRALRERLLEAAPDDLGNREKLADALLEFSETAAAVSHFEYCMTQYAEEDQPAEAADMARRILRAEGGGRIDVLERLYRFLMQDGQDKEALRPSRELAAHYQRSGEIEPEIRWRREVLQLEAENFENRFRLAEALHETGSEDEAWTLVVEALDKAMASLSSPNYAKHAAWAVETLRKWQPDNEEILRREIELCQQTGKEARVLDLQSTLARQLENSGRENEALEIYRELSRNHPERPELFESAASILQALGDTSAFVEWLEERCRVELRRTVGSGRLRGLRERIAEAEPDNLNNRQMLADACLKLDDVETAIEHLSYCADSHSAQGRIEEAAAIYERILSIEPSLHEQRAKWTNLLLQLGRTTEALEQIKTLAEASRERNDAEEELRWRKQWHVADSQDVENRFRLAALQRDAGKEDAAHELLLGILTAAMEALDSKPNKNSNLFKDNSSHAGQALELLRTWRPDDEELLHAQIRYYENVGKDARARLTKRTLAGQMEHQERLQDALELYSDLLRSEPDDDELFDRTADIHRRMDDIDQYCSMLTERATAAAKAENWGRVRVLRQHIMDVRQEDTENIEGLAEACLKFDKKTEAIRYFTRLFELAAQKGATDAAVGHARRILDVQPDHMATRENAAALLEKEDDLDRAYRILEPAGRRMFEGGQRDEALIFQRTMIERFPNLTQPRELLVDWLTELGQRREALDELFGIFDLYLNSGDTHSEVVLELEERMAQCCGNDVTLMISLPSRLLERQQRNKCEQMYCRLINSVRESKDLEALTTLCRRASEQVSDSIRVHEQILEGMEQLGTNEAVVDTALKLGRLYQQGEMPDKASETLRKAVRLAPKNPAAHVVWIEFLEKEGRKEDLVRPLLALCDLYEEKGQLDDAQQCLDRLLAVQPQNEKAVQRRADLLIRLDRKSEGIKSLMDQAARHEEELRWDDAVRYLEQAFEYAPEDIGILRRIVRVTRNQKSDELNLKYKKQLADIYESLGNTDLAIPLYEEMIDQRPEEYDIYEKAADLAMQVGDGERVSKVLLDLSKAHEKQNALDLAIAARLRLYAFDPEQRENLEEIARFYERQGDQANAMKYLREAMGLLRSRHDYAEAVTVGRKILNLDSSQVAVRRDIAQLLESQGDRSAAANEWVTLAESTQIRSRKDKDKESANQAIHALREAVRIDPERFAEHQRLAELLSNQKLEDEAVECYSQLIEKYEQREMLTEAIAVCLQALALRPEDVKMHERLFRFYRNTGETRLQVAEAFWLGRNALQHEDLIRAEEYWIQALEADPKNMELLESLADLYNRQNRQMEAAETYQQLIDLAETDGDPMRVLMYLEEAVACQPHNLMLRRRMVRALVRAEQFEPARAKYLEMMRELLELDQDEAVSDLLQSAQTLFPNDQRLNFELGDLFVEFNQSDTAASLYLEDIEELTLAGRWDEILEICERLLPLRVRPIATYELLTHALEMKNETGRLREIYPSMGEEYERAGKYEMAVEVYRKLLVLEPDSTDLRQTLVSLLSLSGDHEGEAEILLELIEVRAKNNELEAMAGSLRRYLNLHPDDVQRREQYIETWLQLGSEEDLLPDYRLLIEHYRDRNNPSKAAEYLERCLRLQPDDIEMREQQIEWLEAGGETEKALERSLELARVHREKGYPRKAADLLQQRQKAAPRDTRIHLMLSEIFTEMNFKGRALETLKQAASILSETNEKDELIAVYQQILEIDSQNAEVYQNLAKLYSELGRESESIEISMALAELYQGRNLPDLAEGEYRAILERQPENILVLRKLIDLHGQLGLREDLEHDSFRLVELYITQGLVEEAVEVLRHGLKNDSGNIPMRQQLIDLYSQFGDERELVEDYLVLGARLLEVGERQKAIDSYRRILAVEPGNAQARQALKRLTGEALEDQSKSATNTQERERRAAQASKVEPEPLPIDIDELDDEFELPESMQAEQPAVKKPEPVEEPKKPRKARDRKADITDYGVIAHRPSENGGEEALKKHSAELEQAIQNYQLLLERNPDNAEARERLGDCQQQANNIAAAIEQWDTASQLYEKTQQYGKVIKLCEKIVALRPSHAGVRKRLSEAINKSEMHRALDSAIENIHRRPLTPDSEIKPKQR
ncbi:tetratricopeptide repeat protein [Candidatus Sumerlaeota bacterium]|nr:tetratricopeptide repeat protein [Candidatus Sumerlaeota bacterium]